MTTEPSQPAPARRSTYLRSGLVALGVVVVIGLLINFLLLTHRGPGVLDGQVVAQRIAQAIQFNDNGRATTPPTVVCPTSEPLRAGLSFTCTLQRSPGDVLVDVTEQGALGNFTYKVTNTPPSG